jgi:hypothetical protein
MNRFIAIIILLSIAITITLAVIPWITTTLSSLMWRPEILRITEMAIEQSNEGWILKIRALNIGEKDAEIYKVEITGIETIDLSQETVIGMGKEEQIEIPLNKQYTPGTMYTVKLYLKTGTVYTSLIKTATTK